jgi:hypothetical protein
VTKNLQDDLRRLDFTLLQQVEEKLESLSTHLSQQDELLASKLETLARHLEKIELLPSALA